MSPRDQSAKNISQLIAVIWGMNANEMKHFFV